MTPHDNPYAAPPQLPIDSEDASQAGEGISFLRHTGLVTCAGVMLSLYGAGCLFSTAYGLIVYPSMFESRINLFIVISTLRTLALGFLFFQAAYRVWQYRQANRKLALGLITWNEWQRSYRNIWVAINILLFGFIILNVISSLSLVVLSEYATFL